MKLDLKTRILAVMPDKDDEVGITRRKLASIAYDTYTPTPSQIAAVGRVVYRLEKQRLIVGTVLTGRGSERHWRLADPSQIMITIGELSEKLEPLVAKMLDVLREAALSRKPGDPIFTCLELATQISVQLDKWIYPDYQDDDVMS